ncbi:AAA family ATPase [Lactovum miscens]|uniref:5-methylcytosine-specific restriction protein B n=1 Tax=Lactovum miscens TaxID=190387 RepID=A0A841C5W8_9LACT|nr:AAA family ATPase [Lactovum miscens]MBB5887148.1 5-methylcytosine-specific restriction protein B [Lactovum miscens]
MSITAEDQKKYFSDWSKDNLGEKTGIWYAPFLENLGKLFKDFSLDNGRDYFTNFFNYRSFEEFKNIYLDITQQPESDVPVILKGINKRYPNSFNEINIKWLEKYSQMTFTEGNRSKPDNLGGIPALGVLLRAYLKFLYYAENPSLTYPKKDKKTSTHDGEIDESINYWVCAPGGDAGLWNEFYNSNVIGLGWDYLGDLEQYSSRAEIEKLMSEHRNDGTRPINDSKAVWEFYQEIKPGDIVYAKEGVKKIVGRGVVTGEYYFDNHARVLKHRRKINWTNNGSWNLKEQIAMKTLTNINRKPDFIAYIDSLINGEVIDENSLIVNEFKTWLSQQVQQSGEHLNDKTIAQKVSSLKDIENTFHVTVFGEIDTEALKNIKETVLADESYDRYKGVSGSSIDYYIRYVESRPTIKENEPYTVSDFLSEVFIDGEQLNRLRSVLQNKKNLILKGAPGVGKTYIADRLAYLMMEEKDDSRIQMIQFHQSYSYEDFIEGFRPKADSDGFELKQGPFVKFARKAERDPERDYFFIIDEINRGNMSKIFGELMMLIETEKRGKSINLLYSNEKFLVPSNLYLIGMMNTADRSLALLDYALRRRFSFFEISPAFDNSTFKDYLNNIGNPAKVLTVIDEVKKLNKVISEELGTGFQIGHSYFVGEAFKKDANNRTEEVVEYEIIPQLYEYWFDDETKADEWAARLRGAYYAN